MTKNIIDLSDFKKIEIDRSYGYNPGLKPTTEVMNIYKKEIANLIIDIQTSNDYLVLKIPNIKQLNVLDLCHLKNILQQIKDKKIYKI